MAQVKSRIPELIRKFEDDLLKEWVQEQLKTISHHKFSLSDKELQAQCKEFLSGLAAAIQNDGSTNFDTPSWAPVKEILEHIFTSRGQQGFSPSETATFIFSLKRPLFSRLRKEVKSADALAEEIWTATELLDQLGLLATELHQKTREKIIASQQQDMLELSTPVIKLWDGVLALPLIGTLDSARTQVVMESLLQRIVETGAGVAILDITGVPTVDTLVAQHLIKTVTAARLMGADCIISGIRPQIAQTIVHLGVALNNVITKASLADAFQLALQRNGLTVTRCVQPIQEKID